MLVELDAYQLTWLDDGRIANGEEICNNTQLRETLVGNEITPRNAPITTVSLLPGKIDIKYGYGAEGNSEHVLFAFHCSMKS